MEANNTMADNINKWLCDNDFQLDDYGSSYVEDVLKPEDSVSNVSSKHKGKALA